MENCENEDDFSDINDDEFFHSGEALIETKSKVSTDV